MNRPYPWYGDPAAFLLAIFLAAWIAPAKATDWTTTEKAMFGSFVTLQVIDTAQTWKIKDNQDQWVEANPLFGKDPNMAAVIGLKAVFVGGVYWLAKDASHAERKLLLGVVNALYLGVVGHNYSIGLKLGF